MYVTAASSNTLPVSFADSIFCTAFPAMPTTIMPTPKNVGTSGAIRRVVPF